MKQRTDWVTKVEVIFAKSRTFGKTGMGEGKKVMHLDFQNFCISSGGSQWLWPAPDCHIVVLARSRTASENQKVGTREDY